MPRVISSLERSTSVSSIRSTNTPLCFRANNQSNRAVRAPPTCRYPVGDGAKRTRTAWLLLTGSISVVPKRLHERHRYSDHQSEDGSDLLRRDRRSRRLLVQFRRGP